jgi:thioredoxin 1
MATLREATAQAEFDNVVENSRVVLVDFFTPSCVLCKKIEPMLAAVSEKFGEHVAFVKVNAEKNLEVASKYDVRGVPTVVLVQDGKIRDRRTGFMTASSIKDWIAPFAE